MNVKLYNALVDARNFLITDEKNRKAIEDCAGRVRACRWEYSKHMPTFTEEPLSTGKFFFLLWVCFPAALIYSSWNERKNEKNRKKHEQEVQELLNSPEEIKYREEKMRAIEQAECLLEQAKQTQEEYYRNNYQKCLGFLQDFERDIETVEAYMYYVKSGQAFTLEQAWQCRADTLNELDEIRERGEEREEQRRQHKENQEALNRIAKNQERINHELEVANKYRSGEYRW